MTERKTDEGEEPEKSQGATGGVVLLVLLVGGMAFGMAKCSSSSNDSASIRKFPNMATTSNTDSSTLERVLRMPNGGEVPLFVSKTAVSEAMALAGAGTSQALLPYISCIVPSGTRATRLGVSLGGLSEVVVTSGSMAGCRGWLPMEFAK